MTDANRTPQTSNTQNLVSQFVALSKQIEAAENIDNTTGGVAVTYDGNGRFMRVAGVIPLERITNPDGSELTRPINFLK